MSANQEKEVNFCYIEVPPAKYDDSDGYFEVPLIDPPNFGEEFDDENSLSDEQMKGENIDRHGDGSTNEKNDYTEGDASNNSENIDSETQHYSAGVGSDGGPEPEWPASTSRVRRHVPNFYMGSLFTTQLKSSQPRKYVIDNADPEKPYACQNCSYRSRLSGTMRQHQLVHSDAKPFECDECDYRCKLAANLRKHKNVHRQTKPLQCSSCIFKCPSPDSLEKHIVTAHADCTVYECSECNFTATDAEVLRRHRQLHNVEKPYVCNVCGFRCKVSGALRQHELTHSDLRPYKCDMCPYACKVAANLRIHKMSVHSEERPFACDVCEYRCKLPGALRQHKIGHSSFKPYACGQCDYRAKFAANLRKHRLIHSEDRMRGFGGEIHQFAQQ